MPRVHRSPGGGGRRVQTPVDTRQDTPPVTYKLKHQEMHDEEIMDKYYPYYEADFVGSTILEMQSSGSPWFLPITPFSL